MYIGELLHSIWGITLPHGFMPNYKQQLVSQDTTRKEKHGRAHHMESRPTTTAQLFHKQRQGVKLQMVALAAKPQVACRPSGDQREKDVWASDVLLLMISACHPHLTVMYLLQYTCQTVMCLLLKCICQVAQPPSDLHQARPTSFTLGHNLFAPANGIPSRKVTQVRGPHATAGSGLPHDVLETGGNHLLRQWRDAT